MLPNEFHVTLQQAEPMVEDCLDAGLVPILRGSPAMGKSALCAAIANRRNLLLIDERFAGYDPTDMNGFPDLDREKGIAFYFPLATFPLEGDPLPVKTRDAAGNPTSYYDGWLFLADELTSAVPAVQAASYKFFLDRMVGQRKLHPKVQVMAAGNLADDAAIVHDMSTALVSRLINFQIVKSQKEWLEWAKEDGRIHPLITSFIDYRGSDFFYTFNPENPDLPFAAARTWEFASKLIRVMEKKGTAMSSRTAMFAGTVGPGAATALTGFAATWGKLPKLSEILADPENAPLPSEPGAQYALTGAMSEWATADNLPSLIKYFSRLRPDFRVLCFRNINARHQDLKQHPVALQWMADNMDLFLG